MPRLLSFGCLAEQLLVLSPVRHSGRWRCELTPFGAMLPSCPLRTLLPDGALGRQSMDPVRFDMAASHSSAVASGLWTWRHGFCGLSPSRLCPVDFSHLLRFRKCPLSGERGRNDRDPLILPTFMGFPTPLVTSPGCGIWAQQPMLVLGPTLALFFAAEEALG